jgi:cyclopropane-fatty-acyl-phospholipid synthase
MVWTDTLIDRGLVPDPILRSAIRRILLSKLEEEVGRSVDAHIAAMASGPIAKVPELANEQHYEVPAAFYELVLGPRRKYSCCYFRTPDASLAAAEEEALARTCENAELANGQRILELGCGWGSLTLWMAEHYPSARIVAVSNSTSQRAHIESVARERGFRNVRVVTADMNTFDIDDRFDRVVSVEMFEHMCNWSELLRRIDRWLVSGGKLLTHYFCHREYAYFYSSEGRNNWMGRHFFSGGMMPSEDLPLRIESPLASDGRWTWDGRHYARTLRAWLNLLDERLDVARQTLAPVYGDAQAQRWIHRWRVFFIACEELFACNGGREWYVVHHRLVKRSDA